MNVIGIDFSSWFIDLVLVDLDDRQPPRWHRYPLAGTDAFDRARSVADAMPGRSSVYWDNVLAVGIEHPAGKFGTGPLMRIQGAVLAQIPARMLVKPWTPAGWRKAVGLSGSSPKATVMSHAKAIAYRASGDRYLAPDWPQDACDAYCISLATQLAITTEKAA